MTSNKKASLKLVIKKGINLTEQELSQIKKDILREFKIAFNMDDQAKEKLFFLLKQENAILAMGSLWEVKPVIFNGENFSIYGVLNVIANIKGKGYGKRIVTSMIKYLVFHNKTAFGFCMPQNSGFYEKCGFTIDTVSTKRFVYILSRRIRSFHGKSFSLPRSKSINSNSKSLVDNLFCSIKLMWI